MLDDKVSRRMFVEHTEKSVADNPRELGVFEERDIINEVVWHTFCPRSHTTIRDILEEGLEIVRSNLVCQDWI